MHYVLLDFCIYTGTYRYSTFDSLHDICFANVFDSFIRTIKLKTLKFKSSVLFGAHTLLDMLLRVLQLPTHLSKLIANG